MPVKHPFEKLLFDTIKDEGPGYGAPAQLLRVRQCLAAFPTEVRGGKGEVEDDSDAPKKASINVTDDTGQNALHHAARRGLSDIADALIDEDIDINALDHFNHSPLYYAIANDHFVLAQSLITAGAQLNQEFDKGETTPLILALSENALNLAERLLNAGAYPQMEVISAFCDPEIADDDKSTLMQSYKGALVNKAREIDEEEIITRCKERLKRYSDNKHLHQLHNWLLVRQPGLQGLRSLLIKYIEQHPKEFTPEKLNVLPGDLKEKFDRKQESPEGVELLEESTLLSHHNALAKRDEYLGQLSHRTEYLMDFGGGIQQRNRKINKGLVYSHLAVVLLSVLLAIIGVSLLPNKNKKSVVAGSTCLFLGVLLCLPFSAALCSAYRRGVFTLIDRQKVIDALPADQKRVWNQLQQDLQQLTQDLRQSDSVSVATVLSALTNIETLSTNARTLGDLLIVLDTLIHLNKRTSGELEREDNNTFSTRKYEYCDRRFFTSIQEIDERPSDGKKRVG